MKKITADYIVGFTDGEGCFSLHIIKRRQSPFGLFFTPSFSISQNTLSVDVLKEIQTYFDCGFIRQDRKTSKYEIRDFTSLSQKILPFFKKNQLRTQKGQDFFKFCEICKLLSFQKNKSLSKNSRFWNGPKQHSQYSGVVKLLELAYSMNNNGANRRKTKTQLLEELEKWKPKNM